MLALSFDYLRVDRFLDTALHARALATAFELGLIDALATGAVATTEDVQRTIGADRFGVDLLIGILRASGVVAVQTDCIRLSDDFRQALAYRDLIEAKLEFLAIATPDILELFTALIAEPS